MKKEVKDNLTVGVSTLIKGVITTDGEYATTNIAQKVLDFLESIGMLHDVNSLETTIKEIIQKVNMGEIDDENRTVPAAMFCALLEINVDNEKLDDAAFRTFVRNTLPIIIFPAEK